MLPFGYLNLGPLAVLGGGLFVIMSLLVIVLMVASVIFIFKKAGREWWEALIPFYNIYVLTIIVGQPWWMLIGFFIPIVNYIVCAYLYYHLSKRFGFDIPFTIGLFFLPFIFLPILAFGDAVYTKPEIKTEG